MLSMQLFELRILSALNRYTLQLNMLYELELSASSLKCVIALASQQHLGSIGGLPQNSPGSRKPFRLNLRLVLLLAALIGEFVTTVRGFGKRLLRYIFGSWRYIFGCWLDQAMLAQPAGLEINSTTTNLSDIGRR